MTSPTQQSPPPETVPLDEFYAQDDRRKDSPVLSYGSSWKEPGWTDDEHIIEVLWFRETHEIVAFYITYDWSRLAPGQVAVDVTAAFQDISVDSGVGAGRLLGDRDLAMSDVHVRVLGVVASALTCHELLWDWRWVQHHSGGFAHVAQKVQEHDERRKT